MMQKSEIRRGEFTDFYLSSSPRQTGCLAGEVRDMYDQIGGLSGIQYERIFLRHDFDVASAFQERRRVYARRGLNVPAASFLLQPPADGSLIAMVGIGAEGNDGAEVIIDGCGDSLCNSLRIASYGGVDHLYLGNVVGHKGIHVAFREYLNRGFNRAATMMSKRGFDFRRDAVRMWGSIAHIHDLVQGGRNYDTFKEIRRRFFEHIGYDGRFIAATGIGNQVYADGAGSEMSFIAYKHNGQVKRVFMDSPVQVHVAAYGNTDAPDERKSNATFERGIQIIMPNVVQSVVSGTASIDGRDVVGDNLLDQTNITLDSISALLEAYHGRLSDAMWGITYVKPGEDAGLVEARLNDRGIGPEQMPHAIVVGDICFDDLLMETELFAAISREEYNARSS